ncbi:gp43 DNA polymerase [Campylobacter phage NCTC12673]|uniref:DNA-directed DNA polymerase n=2 Tax=Fletchervirus NCTC12673 TaxID=934027 RepID=A0A1B0XWG6_9CAUD|nr:gp43 DNA polymerase [Campylobacter phage NCTC12673]YP_009321758.1 DNA polymerase [Campylobacter phage PC14]AEA86445.1 gp43 DNA polymerase [Campylobacter phage NCTC12673]ANH51450.1 DNA polymerase [Campylobacter phage PC14]
MFKYEYVFEHNFKLYARLYDEVTKNSIIKEYKSTEYVPELFIRTNEKTEYKDFYTHGYLKKKTFKATYEIYQYLKNVSPSTPLYGNINRPQKYIRENFKDIDCNHEFRTQYLDIETRAINGYAKPSNPTEEISLIQVYDNYLNKFIIFGTKDLNIDLQSDIGEVIYKKCDNEIQMLKKYLTFVVKTNPTIIAGFNSNLFDIPYIVNRMIHLGIDDYVELSPIKAITHKRMKTNDDIEYDGVKIEGIIQLDLRDLYIKYTTQKPSRFSLDEISKLELGDTKVNYDGSIEDLYKDFNKFVSYGLKDVELLIKLERKLKLLKVCQLVAYKCGVNADEVSGTLMQWASLMYNYALSQNVILPLRQLKIINYDPPYPGGWVRVIEGLHKNVCSYDFTSLYPNIIIEFKIGLDNYIPVSSIPYEKAKMLEENRARFMNEAPNEVISTSLPEDLKDMLNKYFYFYSETYDKTNNDSMEEFYYFKNIIDNKDHIRYICKKYGVNVTPNGCLYFSDGTSLFSELIENFFKDRLKHKDFLKNDNLTASEIDYHDLMQYMFKILMNSAYGSTSLAINPFSFGKKMSESITTTGRFLNMWVSYRVNKFCNETYNLNIDVNSRPLSIQCDTDSNYFEFKFLETPKDLQENAKFLKSYCETTISPVIDDAISEAVTAINGLDKNSNLGMEQETICDRLISCARKRYVGRYFNKKKSNRGFKITGLPMIDKTTPKWTKLKLNECLDLILDSDLHGLRQFINHIKDEFKQQLLSDICMNKSVSSLSYVVSNDKWVSSINGNPCPIQSRGSIHYNNLTNKYKLKKIMEGEKVYIVYLKTPNTITGDNVICIPDDEIVREIPSISEFVDYETMFEKYFIQKLDIMSKHIGFDYKNIFANTLDEWL